MKPVFVTGGERQGYPHRSDVYGNLGGRCSTGLGLSP
jgi:hypothetical protein